MLIKYHHIPDFGPQNIKSLIGLNKVYTKDICYHKILLYTKDFDRLLIKGDEPAMSKSLNPKKMSGDFFYYLV